MTVNIYHQLFATYLTILLVSVILKPSYKRAIIYVSGGQWWTPPPPIIMSYFHVKSLAYIISVKMDFLEIQCILKMSIPNMGSGFL